MTGYLVGGGIVVAVLVVVFLAGWMTKGANERAKRAEGRLDAIKDKKEIDDEVADLSPADLDKRFDRFMRDDG